jgi:hypothetical protein
MVANVGIARKSPEDEIPDLERLKLPTHPSLEGIPAARKQAVRSAAFGTHLK